MISERNKLKRQEFAQMCLDEEDIFDNVIWSDESSVQLTRHAQTMRVKIGRERVLNPQAKYALKVHIWAAISRRGATRICMRLGIVMLRNVCDLTQNCSGFSSTQSFFFYL